MQDLRKSERLKIKGLTTVLCSIVKHMYKSNHAAPPRRALMYLEKLVDANSSLVIEPMGPKNVVTVRIHPWPSWLTRGSPKLVDFFL